MKRTGLIALMLLLGSLAPARAQSAAESYGRIPLHFEANQGQSAAEVRYQARGQGYGLYLTDSAAVLALDKPAGQQSRTSDLLRLELAGARAVAPVAEEPLAGTVNYFIGNDPAQWRTGLPTFARVRYAQLYPGVDLVYYGNQRQLEYDFVLAPHADAGRIRLHFDGARALRLTPAGDLQIEAAHGSVLFHKPQVYQQRDGRRVPVDGAFELAANRTVGFRLGRYDRDLPLTIDPLLVYASYLGGSTWDGASAIAVDSTGAAYVAGISSSTDFPTTSGAYKTAHTTATAYVTKFNAAGTALTYSTYLGGTGWDMATALAVDSSGNAYIAGQTDSTDFPTTSGALQTTNKAGVSGTAFVTKLNAAGTALTYSTYLGGSTGDFATALAVDSSGLVYVTGQTLSTDFPTTSGAYKTTNAAGSAGTGFVSKLNAAGTALTYSTYLGGSATSVANALAIDSTGSAYVAGKTKASDFPTTSGAYQISRASTNTAAAFVTKLNAAGSALTYSTLLGGSASEYANGIAVDSTGAAYVTGTTASTDFPTTTGAFQTTNGDPGNGNVFVTKLNAAGTALVYSTYLGGAGSANVSGGNVDEGNAIAVDGSGNAIVGGIAYSTNFPLTANAVQSTNSSGSTGFVSELNATGTALLYSTYLGGSVWDAVQALALDASGGLYLAGDSYSANFPVTSGAYQTSNKSAAFDNAFVAKINLATSASVLTATAVTSSLNPSMVGNTVTFTATTTASSGTASGQLTFSVDGVAVSTVALSASGTATYSTSALAAGTHTVTAAFAGGSTYAASTSTALTQTVYAAQTAAPIFSPAEGAYTAAQTVTLSSGTSGAVIYYTTNGATPTTASTKYTGALTVSSSTVFQAIAVATGYSTSTVSTATYTINLPAAAAPTFTPAAGTYTAAQTVTLSSTTSGAAIYYTTDGSTPTATSTLYSAPLTVSSSQTIKAVALASGYSLSAVASAAYTINTPTFTLAAGALTVTRGASSGNTATVTITPANGFTGSVALTATLSSSPTGATSLPTLSFGSTTPVTISGATAGTATLTVTTTAATTARAEPFRMGPTGGGTVLACLLLFGFAGIRRRSRLLLGLCALCLAIGLGATGCGKISTATSSTTSSGTTAGTYTVTVTGASGTLSKSTTFTLTVQ